MSKHTQQRISQQKPHNMSSTRTSYVTRTGKRDLSVPCTKGVFRRSCHICQQGVPSSVQTDNGTCYTGSKFKKMMNTQKIRHKLSSPYSPQSNGLVERFNVSIGTALRTFCSQNQKTWDLYIESITFGLNNTDNRLHTVLFTPRQESTNHCRNGPRHRRMNSNSSRACIWNDTVSR